MKQYETVFIATPVLSDDQMKEAVAKYVSFIKDNGGEVVYEEDWGLKQLAYPIQHKTSGFYHLIEFKANPEFVTKLETQYHRDERIIRYLTVALDKDAAAYAEKRRANKLLFLCARSLFSNDFKLECTLYSLVAFNFSLVSTKLLHIL